MLQLFRKFTPQVSKDQIHQGPVWTAAERNVRVPVGVHAHAAPDPPREGFTPSRPAMTQVVTFAYDTTVAMGDARFQAPNLVWNPVVARPPGRQAPHQLRQNIPVPAHIAYGSMLALNYQPSPYWR